MRAAARESRSGPSHPVRRTTAAQIDILAQEIAKIYGCRKRHATKNRHRLGFLPDDGGFDVCG